MRRAPVKRWRLGQSLEPRKRRGFRLGPPPGGPSIRAPRERNRYCRKVAQVQAGERNRLIKVLEIADLARALDAPLQPHQRFMLRTQLARIEQAEADLERIDTTPREMIAPYDHAMGLLTSIPGIEWINTVTIIAEKYRRLAARHGKLRAAAAVAHKILIAVWHRLSNGTFCQELGAGSLDGLHRERTAKHLVRRLANMGFDVHLRQAAA